MTDPRTIRVAYYAGLREAARRSDEVVESRAERVADLYEELASRYGFVFPRDRLKAAVNDEFCDWNAPLRDGDSVAFLPPVAGG
jgi:molybdopterin converting factor subunit 1